MTTASVFFEFTRSKNIQRTCSISAVGSLLLTLYSLYCPSANAESLDNLMAIVQIEQSRSYGDINRLQRTLNAAPLARVELASGSSPSELIKNIYGFGSSDSKEAYQLIENRVLDLNGAKSPTHLRAGKIIVPDLPTLTSKIGDHSHEPAIIVGNSSRTVEIQTSGSLKSPYSKIVNISHPITDSLVYTRVELYPANEATAIIEEAEKNGARLPFGVESGIQLSDDSGACAESSATVLSQEDRNTISKALMAPADNTERYVLVLDTGWPTLEYEKRSLQIMREIFDKVSRGIRLPNKAIAEKNEISPEFIPPSHSHACMINRSLREFTDLDKNERIKLVFLPLKPGQNVARDLFREIIELDQIILALGGDLFVKSPSPYQILSAKEFADKALNQIPALKNPWEAGDDVVRIYEPLISGLIRILDTYTRIYPEHGESKVDARFWLSLSWNFTKFVATPALPSSDSYMVFAAAGNDGRDFVAARRLFASEATVGWRVFAVMNSDSKGGGLTCKSALYKDLWTEDVLTNIGSFPGDLENGLSQPCPGVGGGTSFSTPRLAWLAAASDTALRAKNLNWQKTISLRLLKSRNRVDGDPYAAPVQVSKLFAPQ